MKHTLIFAVGLLFFLIFLFLPLSSHETNISFFDSLRYSAATFYGRPATDLAQDIFGLRAMVMRENAYPILTIAHTRLGLDFPVNAKSTHPPTTFLFVAPVAFLPWKYASMIWAFLMLLGMICTFRVLGFPWPSATGYGFLSILWLPVMMSFGQLSILWLLLIALANKTRNEDPLASGFFIGLASLIKLFPALMLMPFLLQKKWNAIFGFLLAGALGVASVLLISPGVVFQYLEAQGAVQSTLLRWDNSSLFNVGYQHLGLSGFLIVVFLFGIFLWWNRKYFVVGEQNIQGSVWMVWTFLSVTLLPVIWIYSLVPLLPIIVDFIRSKNSLVKLVGWISLVMPVWGHPWGAESVPLVAGMTLLIGTGITINNSLHTPERLKTNDEQTQCSM